MTMESIASANIATPGIELVWSLGDGIGDDDIFGEDGQLLGLSNPAVSEEARQSSATLMLEKLSHIE